MAQKSRGKLHSIPLVLVLVMLVSLVPSLEAQLIKRRSKFMHQVRPSARETTRVATKVLPQSCGHKGVRDSRADKGVQVPVDGCHLRGSTRQQYSFRFQPGQGNLPWKELLTPDQIRLIPRLRRIPGTPPQQHYKIEPGEPGDPPMRAISLLDRFGPFPPH